MSPASHRLLTALLLLGLLAAARDAGPALRRARDLRPAEPLRIDVHRDPPARLRLLRGVGPARAARILAARRTGPDDESATALLRRALGPRLGAQIAARPLIENPGAHR